jgi:acetate kinase
MYVIEPVIGKIHLYWMDSFDIVQHTEVIETAGKVDIQRFPGLASSTEVVLILPAGMDILSEVQSRLDSRVLNLLSDCARRLPEYNQTTHEIASQLADKYLNLPVNLICNSAFFAELPIHERSYALDSHLFKSTYQRSGSDGLCHFGAVKSIQAQFPQSQKVISIHLCNQPSITAWQNDIPVYSSMGYSPLEGLISADGCGSIDPGIPLMLADSGYSPAEIRRLLVENSGWNALSGQRVDINELLGSLPSDNSIAWDILLDQIMEQIGSACSVMGGLDTIIFTVDYLNGSNTMIAGVTSRLGWLGYRPSSMPVVMDGQMLFSGEGSSLRVLAMKYSPVEIISSFL